MYEIHGPKKIRLNMEPPAVAAVATFDLHLDTISNNQAEWMKSAKLYDFGLLLFTKMQLHIADISSSRILLVFFFYKTRGF